MIWPLQLYFGAPSTQMQDHANGGGAGGGGAVGAIIAGKGAALAKLRRSRKRSYLGRAKMAL